jgi:hypothetical protein
MRLLERSHSFDAAELRQQAAQDRKAALFISLTAAGLSLVVSIWLFVTGDREQGLFVGLWVPSIIGLAHLLMEANNND